MCGILKYIFNLNSFFKNLKIRNFEDFYRNNEICPK